VDRYGVGLRMSAAEGGNKKREERRKEGKRGEREEGRRERREKEKGRKRTEEKKEKRKNKTNENKQKERKKEKEKDSNDKWEGRCPQGGLGERALHKGPSNPIQSNPFNLKGQSFTFQPLPFALCLLPSALFFFLLPSFFLFSFFTLSPALLYWLLRFLSIFCHIFPLVLSYTFLAGGGEVRRSNCTASRCQSNQKINQGDPA